MDLRTAAGHGAVLAELLAVEGVRGDLVADAHGAALAMEHGRPGEHLQERSRADVLDDHEQAVLGIGFPEDDPILLASCFDSPYERDREPDLPVGLLPRVVFKTGEGPFHCRQQLWPGGICPQCIQGGGGFLGGPKLSRHAGDRL